MGKEKAADVIGDMIYITAGLICLALVTIGWAVEKLDDKIWALRSAL
jgi:hypothetical protein